MLPFVVNKGVYKTGPIYIKQARKKKKLRRTFGTVDILKVAFTAFVKDVFAASMFEYVLWNDCMHKQLDT